MVYWGGCDGVRMGEMEVMMVWWIGCSVVGGKGMVKKVK